MAAEEVVEGGTYRSQLAMCKLGTSAFVDNVLDFEQYVIHLPWTTQKSHGIGANHNAANASSEHLEEAIQLVVMMATDWDMQQQYTNLAGQSPYETVAHIEAAPEGPAKDVDLMAISRIEGMSTIPENTTPFAWRCGWYGIEPFVFRDRMAEAMQEVLLGEKTTQEAMDDAKAEFDAHLADARS
jgi:maltose-binding protein MalE